MLIKTLLATAVLISASVALWTTPPTSHDAASSRTNGPLTGRDMVPTFAEDFNGAGVDGKRWNTHLGPRSHAEGSIGRRSLWANGEAQIYFDRNFLGIGIDPFQVTGGQLTISARSLSPVVKEKLYGELARHPEFLQYSKVAPRMEYSSGALTTRDVFQQRYGYFEVRARWSAGKGVWPAFWLLPADGGWPPELDVIEAHGDKPLTAFQTFHPRNAPPAGVVAQTDGAEQGFHVYGALWAPDHIDFYVDGRKTGSAPSAPEMNKPMYLIVNLAIGGYWPGYPESTQGYAASMSIDYVRAWQFRSCLRQDKPCLVS